MTQSFKRVLLTSLCILALGVGQVLSVSAMATGGSAAPKAASEGTLQSGVGSVGRGLEGISETAKPYSDTIGSVSGAAGALGYDGLNQYTDKIGSVTDTLNTAQDATKQVNDFLSAGNKDGKGFSLTDAFGTSWDGVTKKLGAQYDALKGINMDNIWGSTTNFMKDMTADIKMMVADYLDSFDLVFLKALFPPIGILTDLLDVTAADSLDTVQALLEKQATQMTLDETKAMTASIGSPGIMDGRLGMCIIEDIDYTPMLRGYITGPGQDVEGYVGYLHLDTVCVITVGIGSALHINGSSKNSQSNYFMAMPYSHPRDVQEKDFEIMWAEHDACCAGGKCDSEGKCPGKCINKAESSYKKLVTGFVKKTDSIDVAITELCANVKKYHEAFKNKKNFYELPLWHQYFIVDIGYQGGPGTVTSNPALQSALAQKDCAAAISLFNGIRKFQATEDTSRNEKRRGMIQEGCKDGATGSGAVKKGEGTPPAEEEEELPPLIP